MLTRALDDDARSLALVARPLTRPLVLGNSSRRTRRRLGLVIAAVSQCRALSVALQRRTPDQVVDGGVAVADRRPGPGPRAAHHAPGGVRRGRARPRARCWPGATCALFERRDAGNPDRDSDPVVRHLHHLSATLSQLAETGPTYAVE